MKKAVLFLPLCFIAASILFAQNVSLQLAGDEAAGYFVKILYGGKDVISNHLSGELDLVVENADRSITDTLHNWKATRAEITDNGIRLSGQYYQLELMTDITIEEIYEIINDHVVKKEIRLEQHNIPLLFYQIENKVKPAQEVASYWSFDHLNHQGGSIREIYPATGFFLDNSIAVGVLTDAGYKNLWTRNIRKRPADQRTSHNGFKAVNTIADVNLYHIADPEERSKNNNYVSLTFGELSDYNAGQSTLLGISFLSAAIPHNAGAIDAIEENHFTVSVDKDQPDTYSGIHIPFTSEDGYYTIKFKYRTEQPFNLRLLKTYNNTNEVTGFHYKSDLPAAAGDWKSFEESALLQGLEGGPACLLIEGKADIQIADLEILKISPKRYPYHRMCLGEKQTKTIYLFVQEANDLRDIRLASQTRLAEGMGFTGPDEQKVLYADFMMLTWITSAQDFSPHNVPSINYSPDMYNRDSFWSVVSIDDEKLNKEIWKKWGGTQAPDGAIGTIITPFMGSVEKKGNEATCQWIWWALLNKRRYHSDPDMERLKKALDFCFNEFDPDRDGVVSAHFSLSQNDVVYYEQKKTGLAVNQGVYAITLMAAKELGFDIDREYIDKALQEYREYYDEEKGYMVSDRDFPYVVSFTDLMPEFVSWWMWNKPVLDSDMVINTLNKFPVINHCSPLIFHVADTFFTPQNKPFLPEQMWPDGQYYNGGSWMRNEICAYVAGMKHGWEPAEERIKNRMLAEIDLNYDEPISHEIIPMDLSQPGCWWPSARVFSWNVFALVALEVAGLK